MALEGFNHFLETGSVGRRHLDAVAIVKKRSLQLGDTLAFIARA